MNNDLEDTIPNHPITAKPEPDAFDQILHAADHGFDPKTKKATEDDGLKLLDSDKVPEWLDEEDYRADLPSWLAASAGDDLVVQNGLPRARNTIPEWMTERDSNNDNQHTDFSEFRWDPEVNSEKDEKKFDPNETQKTKAVKREDPAILKKVVTMPKPSFINLDKHDKAFLGLGAIGLYLIIFNLIGWAIPTGIDNLIIDVIGLYLYNVLADKGYDVRNLLPRKQK